jgi:hypothetical protein
MDFTPPSSGAGFGESFALAAPGGYLDDAIPKTMFRIRYDAGFDLNRPDRAEFFYAEWHELSFHPHGVQGDGVFFDPKARGPKALPSSVDYQEASAYLEVAYDNKLSLFASVPTRFISFRDLHEDNPESELKRNPNDLPGRGSRFFPEPGPENAGTQHTAFDGLSDVDFGIKYAIVADPCQYLTTQLRVYSPSGDASKGLGTGHWSLEPGLLYYQRLSDRLVFQAELKDWIPVDGGAASGNILRYGFGLGYDIYQRGNLRITPVTEMVGWTVLYGFQSFFGNVVATPTPGLELPHTHGVEDASGDTIINGKIGVRTYFGHGHDLYIGYGRALTGDRWYQDIVRVEYRFVF